MITIIKYPNSEICKNKYNHEVFKFHKNRQFKSEIIIAPHNQETFINVQLYRLFIWCNANNIKVTTIGSLNQLPLMSLISHEAILQKTDLNQLFNSHSSFAVDITKYDGLHNFEDVYDGSNTFVVKAASITDIDVINYYKNLKIYIHEDAISAFNLSGLQSSKICCEIKQSHYQGVIDKIASLYDDNIIGLDKKFQKQLVSKNRQHYMSFQILLSILGGWKFISGGGATNLFCIIPVNCCFMIENIFDFSLSAQRIKKELNMYYFGNMPTTITYDTRLYYDQGDFSEIPIQIYKNSIAQETKIPEFEIIEYNQVVYNNPSLYVYKRTGFPDAIVELKDDGVVGNAPGTWEAYWKEENGKIYLHDKSVSRIELDKHTLKGQFINSHLNGVSVSLEPC